ncbi:AarF/ABC1/UbiB kinase family protein [Gramella sp. AN32]|uniref:ABC1 kinase family protein n=1 Tax=Christiangramia antarctica TaxID=2058158 RepID=A0ABW5X9H6_9FLAO|nr:AarF/ABC1/UbiB kinase family protein [Gramella sp. AN32]MCM4154610.1 ABC transporter [Gramella sp. AN32]
MKTIDKIPTGKIGRTSKMVKTGVKIGGNYLKYYSKKAFNSKLTRDELDNDNAEDIYDGLKSLKGSALKVAQMLSMEKSLLPSAYVEKFSLSQFSVPPLSAPLVRKTFKKYNGKYPEELYDTFTPNSVNAASIGQVHKATKGGKELAVKIQYPGVADSISSDLSMVKPIAIKMFNLQGKDSEKYFKEVEGKLLEETDYILELKQSKAISEACHNLPNIKFPKYYPELSSERIITMDWMHGVHLSEFVDAKASQDLRNKIGQSLWNFYMFQIHGLKEVHADPHPGNFLIDEQENLIAIDFGCIKKIPESFYGPYFSLTNREKLNDAAYFEKRLFDLEILTEKDTVKEIAYFKEMFYEMFLMFSTPYQKEKFNFSDPDFWNHLTKLSESYSQDPELRKMNGNRGSKHFLYMSRTFFGLYNLLHDLEAEVDINEFREYL